MHQITKVTPAWNSTCFGQFLCPSSGVYSLTLGTGIRRTGLKTAFEQDQDGKSWSCSKAVYKPVRHIPVPSVQWINSWWWTEELPETCRFSCRSKFGKLVHLVGFIIKKYYECCVLSGRGLCVGLIIVQRSSTECGVSWVLSWGPGLLGAVGYEKVIKLSLWSFPYFSQDFRWMIE